MKALKTCRNCNHSWVGKKLHCPECGDHLFKVFLPTQEEIEQGKLRIQNSWSEQVEISRRQMSVQQVTATQIKHFRNVHGSKDSSDN